MSEEYVKIYDTTLRDGEQTPGVTLTPSNKTKIAIKLDKLGVDVIEVGFPIISQGEMEATKQIVKQNLSCEISGLARTEKKDIDAVINCDLKYVHTFIATSDIHLKYKLKKTRDEVLQKAIEAVEYAKSHGLMCEFSAEDSTRTDREFLKQVYKQVVDAGTDRIDVPDTVGYSNPKYIDTLIRDLRTVVNVPISIHCHDDFGLAVANSLTAIEAGASCAHVTINGLGERAGNTSLEEFVMASHCLYGKKTQIKTKLLYEISKIVSNLTGVVVQPNKAIIGENAFGHESGIHTHGVISNPLTYEPINPEMVGRKRWLEAGKHAGLHGISAMLEEYGLIPSQEQLKEIVAKVKDLGDKGKHITDADLLAIASQIMRQEGLEQRIKLNDFVVTTGMNVVPTASVRLIIEGKEFTTADTGLGPVDAALKAIQKITDKLANITLREFKLESITGGSNALAEVSIKVEDKDGHIASTSAAGEDIVVTSLQAMINGLNRIMHKQAMNRNKNKDKELRKFTV
ncbi:MAG: 2-isopropylmalate synthase [Thaumarchaeota archaeon]|nr:2-isopropylmalate synthase [Nitrososphaerota archaeon]|tara:strand:+ start:585 stop:2126 length:1542 start_codon:yes stop_codon:yes gene_type:complete